MPAGRVFRHVRAQYQQRDVNASTEAAAALYPLNETFTGASGPPAAHWTTSVVGTGVVELDTNRLEMAVPAQADVGQALLDDIIPTGDVELRASYTYTVSPAQTVGFNFRGDGVWQSSGQWHLFTNSLAIVPIVNVGEVRLYSTVASVSSQLGASLSLAIGATDTVHFHVIADGADISWKAWLNADPEPGVWQTATDADHTARTRLGLGLRNPLTSSPVTAYWDDIVAQDIADFTGTLAETLGDATSAAAGGSGATGALAETLEDTTVAADGTSAQTGTLAVTLANVTSAASAASGASGELAETLADTTSAASGSLPTNFGTVAVTLAAVRAASVILDESGNPVLDESGNPVLGEGASGTWSPEAPPPYNAPPHLIVTGGVFRRHYTMRRGQQGAISATAASTLNVTLDAVTSAGTGTVGQTGTLAVTLANVVTTTQGSQVVGTVDRTLENVTQAASAGGGITGTLAETLDNAVVQAAGGLGVTGTLAETLDAVTGVAAGAFGALVTGTVAVTLDSVEVNAPLTDEFGDPITDESGNPILIRGAEGSHGIGGTLAVTLAAVTPTATGGVAYAGSLSETLADATLAAVGTSGQTGSLAETLENVTVAAEGVVGASGTLTETLGDATSAAAGDHTPPDSTIAGSVNVTLAAVTSTADGSSVSGTLSETLADATVAVDGLFTISGSLAVTLAPVTATASGAPGTTGTVARTLADVVADGVGSSVVGSVAVTLADVTATTSATVSITVYGVGRIEAVYSCGRIESIYDTGPIKALAGSTS